MTTPAKVWNVSKYRVARICDGDGSLRRKAERTVYSVTCSIPVTASLFSRNCYSRALFVAMHRHFPHQLISPFVGRIYDWYKAKNGVEYTGAEDPGVQSVTQIYNYYKKFGYKTEVMGASSRNSSQITELAGSDLLTISPNLLEEMQNDHEDVSVKLTEEQAHASNAEKIHMDENAFRFLLNEDPMATEKLAEGIRRFAADVRKLEDLLSEKLNS